MKPTHRRKLTLSRQVIRRLDALALSAVAGGAANDDDLTKRCSNSPCPTAEINCLPERTKRVGCTSPL